MRSKGLRLLLAIGLVTFLKAGHACSLAVWGIAAGTVSALDLARYQGSCGLRVDLTGAASAYVGDDTPAGLTPAVADYVARFYIYLGDMTLSDSDAVNVFTAYTSGLTELFGVEIFSDGVDRYVRVYARDDSADRIDPLTPGVVLRTGWRALEVQWSAATGPANNDGFLSLTVDGNAGMQSLAGLDTDTQRVGSARLGVIAGNSATVTGAIDFDEFTTWRTGSPGLLTKTCSGGTVNLDNATFLPGTRNCTANSISLGNRVVFDVGSTVTFTSPTVVLQPGVRVLRGAVVSF